MLRSFLAYCFVLSCVLGVGAVLVHVLMAQEYRINVSERLAVMVHDGEEAVENAGPGKQLESGFSKVLTAPDEGLAWFDDRHNLVVTTGMTTASDGIATSFRLDQYHAGGLVRATIANSRVGVALEHLDLGLAIGGLIAVLSGGLIITAISRRAVVRVENAYQRVYRFTGDAAHELRTPLAVIASNADRLVFANGKEAYDERSLGNIRQAAQQMRDLMDGLLLLARADEGIARELHAVDVAACVESVVETYRAEAMSRGLTFTSHVTLRSTIYGHPEQIARIIGNLVENALRYTPAGGTVEVTCTADRNAAVIVVHDTGPGIEEESIERIFDRFWRGNGSRGGDGSGLGLPIARSLARAHGGEVLVTSRVGLGSTFTVRLPLRPQRPAARFSTLS